MSEEENNLELEGILSQGYGVIPKKVMRDTRLSAESKAIYAYLCSFSGHGNTAFPSIKLMCRDLKMGKDRFYKHRKELIENGYIQIVNRKSDNKYISNIYKLPVIPYPYFKDTQIKDTQIKDTQNKDTINNNPINNNSINNSNKSSSSKEENPFQLFQEIFGVLNPINQQDINYWIDDLGTDLVIHAMKKAALDNKPYSWAVGVMKNWANKNLRTIEVIEADEKAFKRNSNFKPKTTPLKPTNSNIHF